MNRIKQPHIFWQILLWWGIWLFIYFILTNGVENPQRFFQKSVGLLLGMTLIIELNIRYLLPQFYFRQRHTLFILSGMILLGVTVLLLYSSTFPWSDWFNAMPPKPEGLRPRRGPDKFSGFRWLGRLMPFIVAFMGSSLTEIARYANRKAQEAIQLEKEKLSTELKFLKSQINPHFVFNALNNIYSMAVMQAPETPESVMQLAEILRYMVYDSNEKRVPLNNEITYIENFVGLKMLKDSQGMDVKMELDKHHPQLMIPPLLFIPLVENAFKHSKIEDLKRGYIRISLSVTDDVLLFYVDNSVPPNEFTKDKIGGVGLENIKQRLALIYTEDQYQLDIKSTADRFEVWLKLVVG